MALQSMARPAAALTEGHVTKQYTPGPWAAFTDGNHTNIVSISDQTRLVFALPGRDKDEPDVRLATAAPDLLDTLKGVIDCFEAEGTLSDAVVARACEVLARVDGEST